MGLRVDGVFDSGDGSDYADVAEQTEAEGIRLASKGRHHGLPTLFTKNVKRMGHGGLWLRFVAESVAEVC